MSEPTPKATTPGPFSPEGLAKIADAAMHLCLEAASLVGNDPHLALVALVLACGHMSAVTNTPYNDLVKLIADHYEYVMLKRAEDELAAAGEKLLPKPPVKV